MKTTLYVLGATLAVSITMLGGVAANADGQLTRTFNAVSLAEIEFKGLGTGIYDSTTPANGVCPISILGLRVVGSSVFYYGEDRETVNVKTGDLFVAGPGNVVPGLFNPCPFPLPFGKPGNFDLMVEDMNLYAPYTAVSIDQVLCDQANFKDCTALPNTALAELGRCVGPTFNQVADTKNVLSGTLSPTLGSRDIVCTSSANVREYYDGAPLGYCDSWFFDGANWGTSFCLIQVEDIVSATNLADDTGYMVTCMRTDYFYVDSATVPPTTGTAFGAGNESHDYMLVLDVEGNPGSWSGAKGVHWDVPGLNQPLQGWHDLGGKNGCPWAMGSGAMPPNKKTNSLAP